MLRKKGSPAPLRVIAFFLFPALLGILLCARGAPAWAAQPNRLTKSLPLAARDMEFYYRKYSTDTKYQIRRDIADIKFRRKKKKEMKNKPKPVYVPPKRTAEEQAEINRQMKRLYKEYRVGFFESIRRQIKAMSKEEQEKEHREPSVDVQNKGQTFMLTVDCDDDCLCAWDTDGDGEVN